MRSIVFNIPGSWNSLSNQQLIKISLLFFSNQSSKIIDYALFKIFTNYKWYKIGLYRKIRFLFKNRQVSEIKNHFSFIYTKQDLTRFIPTIKIKKNTYYAPAERLTNISIGEFSVCEDLYLGYLRSVENKEHTNAESYLRYLFAVLYIPQETKIRPNFNKALLEDAVAETENVKQKYLLTTLLSYKGCRDAITNNAKYKHIFPKSEIKTEAINQHIPKSSGFSEVILSFSGKLFGEYDKTFNTNLFTFLDAYELTLQNLEKQQK